MERRLGEVVVDAIQFSQTLSRNIENQLRHFDLSIDELSDHPDALEWIANEELELVLVALDKTKVSGAFVVLAATVNPRIEGAEFSRAGIFIRNPEPVAPGSSYKFFLRGFADLAYKNALSLLSNWRLEFNIKDRDYYTAPVAAFRENHSLPLARSYYWTFTGLYGEYSEEEPTLLCSIPIISSQGTFLGVCGFEISTLNFRYIHNPVNDPYPRLLGRFGPHDGKKFNDGRDFLSGNMGNAKLRKNPPLWEMDYVFMDDTEIVKLYPGNSPYIGRKMALTLGMPRQDYEKLLFSRNSVLVVIILLLGGGIFVLSFLINSYYKKSYAEQLEKLQALLVKAPPNFAPYGLSKREKEICLLLLKGFTIKAISVELFIAFATVNNHCQTIYRKLEINSRQELFIKFGA
jgi:DNA-binding CsgD family transcriptional regulator